MPDESKLSSILSSVSKPPIPTTPRCGDENESSTAQELTFEALHREKAIRDLRYQMARYQDQLFREKEDRIAHSNEEHELRKTYIHAIFILVCLFLIIVMEILISSGCCILFLSDSVLITLLTTTTANVIGILLIAFKWLFPNGKK